MTTPPPDRPLPPWLTPEEIDELCKPLKQRHAQTRWLRNMLGVEVQRRPDGMPLVGRKLAEKILGYGKVMEPGERPPRMEPNWTKP